MNSLQLLEAIGDVNGKYILEAQTCREHKPRRRASKLKVLILAAALALLLTGCTYAVLKLHDLKVGQWTPKPFQMNEEEKRNPPAPRDMLSLQGFAGTPEYLANREWLEFESGYDLDGALLHQEDQARNMPPEAYDAVFAYTSEMQAKVDELCEKYGLKLPGRRIQTNEFAEDFFIALGIPSIHKKEAAIENAYDNGSYYYPNGSFRTSGNLWLTDSTWTNEFSYSYGFVRKGYFDSTAAVAVADINAFDQWKYTAADGTKLLLAISPEQCLVLADRPDAFISISVYYPSLGESYVFGDEPMTHKALESFADSFDYKIRPLGIGQTYESYADFLMNLYPVPTREFMYILQDLDGDGSDELLVNRNGSFNLILTMEDGKAKIIYFAPDLRLMEDNVIWDNNYASEYDSGETRWRFLKFRNGEPVCVDYVEYSPLKSQWGKSVSLGDKPYFDEAISEDEAYGIMDRYTYAGTRWESVFGFPGYEGPGAYKSAELPPVEPGSDREKLIEATWVDPLEFADAKIIYNGKTYVYRCPASLGVLVDPQVVGQLTYPLDGELSTNCQRLATWDVVQDANTPGGWLRVETMYEQSLYFVPEDMAYPEEFTWEENEDGSVTILKYLGREANVEVPDQIDRKHVTILGEVFADNPYVEHVTIPEGVKTLQANTFYGCLNLRSARFPESLQGIGHSVFQVCPLLEDLWFQGNAPYLGNYIFFPTAADRNPPIRLHYPDGSTGWDESIWPDFEHIAE